MFDQCVFLTGTPIQNSLTELFVLLNFLDPYKFESEEGFLSKYKNIGNSTQVEELHQLLSPYLLRRMKNGVEKSLKPREEILIEVELTHIEKAILQGNI
eukprot:TRINITY_DN1158_c0_g1_i1.p1 TRINITY_DN1158_c0_g1~~TRINITY_DN1158_c0_g1_i1.p1  ORF type:complete len:99 (+),score=12.32 TRINITY_DN1158_c0_g1_i1:333-629(+)